MEFEDSAIRALVPSLALDGWQLAYSYETCGNLNSYSPVRHYDLVRNRVFRVSYPGDSSSGYTLVTDNNGNRDGSMVKLMQEVAVAGQFTWEPHAVSNDSLSRYSSSYTACVHEVALNRTDICIGNFWCVSRFPAIFAGRVAVLKQKNLLIHTPYRFLWRLLCQDDGEPDANGYVH